MKNWLIITTNYQPYLIIGAKDYDAAMSIWWKLSEKKLGGILSCDEYELTGKLIKLAYAPITEQAIKDKFNN